jgi:NAD(P)H-dependent flavin oxidoreductase YrpB (nitropropane dioxygenase family)
MGASAVWVGTRFICAKEAGAPPRHQKAVINAGYHDTFKTLVFTGRPLRIGPNSYAKNWEENRRDEMKQLLARGILPYTIDAERDDLTPEQQKELILNHPNLMGQVAGAINEVKPAAEIMEEMLRGAVDSLNAVNKARL